MSKQSTYGTAPQAVSSDVREILGDVANAKVTKILALKPSLADLEDAATCMTGDHDILAKSGHHVPVTAARIIELLVEEEEAPEK